MKFAIVKNQHLSKKEAEGVKISTMGKELTPSLTVLDAFGTIK